jgi:protein involved in polysaccharide export with SLBB domain
VYRTSHPAAGLVLIFCTVGAFSAGAQRPQAGDRLAVRIFGSEQLVADTLTVSPSGTVVLPKLGAVDVSGFDARTLPDSLRERYARYLRNPTVDVVVLRRIVVLGEVKRPDIYYMDLNTTLPDLIAHAGGITESANNRVSLKRGTTVSRIADWETNAAVVGSLQSGDQILMGRRSWLSQNALAAASTAAVLVSLFISLRR